MEEVEEELKGREKGGGVAPKRLGFRVSEQEAASGTERWTTPRPWRVEPAVGVGP